MKCVDDHSSQLVCSQHKKKEFQMIKIGLATLCCQQHDNKKNIMES